MSNHRRHGKHGLASLGRTIPSGDPGPQVVKRSPPLSANITIMEAILLLRHHLLPRYPRAPCQVPRQSSVLMRTHLLCRSTFFDAPALLPFWMQISTSYLGRPATVHSNAHASSVSCPFDSQTCIHKRIYSTYVLTHFQTHSDSHSAVVYQSLVRSRLTRP